MSSLEVRFQLKKPVLVYALGVCFVLAPLGNVIGSMIGFGVYHWYSPATISRFVGNISWVDRSWLLLTMAAGFALFHQRKWAWLLAISSLVMTSVFNLHYGMQYSSTLAHGKYFFPVAFMLSNLSVVAILFHFRYPYLDRREAWWGMYPRYACTLPVKGDGFSGSCMNISRSGAFIENLGMKLEIGQIITIQLREVSNLKAEVVRSAGNGYGIQFNPSRSQRAEIRKLVSELHVAPMGEAIAA